MNNPNPLLPQGSLHGQSKGKSNFRIAVFTILGIHVVLICGFLIFGCKPEPVQQEETTMIEPTNPPVDTFDSFEGTDAAATPFPTDSNTFPPYDEPAPTNVGTANGGVQTSVPPVVVDAPTNLTPSIPTTDPLPIPGPVPDTAPAGEMTTHVVASGETLSGIAPKYKVTVRAIEDANPGLNPNRLQIGQKINIPAPAASTTSAATTSATSSTGNGEYISYTVKSGDVLERIARNHGTTVQAIKNANGLRTDRINVGQKLKIPAKTN